MSIGFVTPWNTSPSDPPRRSVPPEIHPLSRAVGRPVGQRKSTTDGNSPVRGTLPASCQTERRTGAGQGTRPASMPFMSLAGSGTSKRCPSGTVSAAPAAERWGLKNLLNRKWPGLHEEPSRRLRAMRDRRFPFPSSLAPSSGEGREMKGTGNGKGRIGRGSGPLRGPHAPWFIGPSSPRAPKAESRPEPCRSFERVSTCRRVPASPYPTGRGSIPDALV